jgi:sensor histidine kinase YesM
MLIMSIVIVSYALAFYMAFGHVVRGYMDFAESLFTLFKSTMGQFTIRELSEVNSSGRYLGPFLFVSFIVLNLFVILSMLFAMVNVSFQNLRDEMVALNEHPENDPMVVDMAR